VVIDCIRMKHSGGGDAPSSDESTTRQPLPSTSQHLAQHSPSSPQLQSGVMVVSGFAAAKPGHSVVTPNLPMTTISPTRLDPLLIRSLMTPVFPSSSSYQKGFTTLGISSPGIISSQGGMPADTTSAGSIRHGNLLSRRGMPGGLPISSIGVLSGGLPVDDLTSRDLSFACIKSQLQSKVPLSIVGGTYDSRLSADRSPAVKRIKLEVLDDSSDVSVYRLLYLTDREREVEELRLNYDEHNAELFFLQNYGNFMDYFTWRKRPNVVLTNYLQTNQLGTESEIDIGEEKQINNEVKVLTTSGGTRPIATPIAISMTLPPAVKAMQQQQQMDQGGKPLSPTAATTTIAILPSYTQPSVSTIRLPVMSISSSVAVTSSLSEDFDTSQYVVISDVTESHVDSNVVSVLSDANVPEGVSTLQEALVEMAKQEAQVMQRVSELRKNGMWSERRLPRVQEPPRCKSNWDYLLEEMQWMAVDFVQEKQWKISAAKMMAHTMVRYHAVQGELTLARQELEVKQIKRTAGTVAGFVNDFWADMSKMALHQRHRDKEMDEERLVRLVFDAQRHVSHCSDDDDDDDDFSDASAEADLPNLIKELIEEGEMPLDELVQKYTRNYDVENIHSSSSKESSAHGRISASDYVDVSDIVRLTSSLRATLSDVQSSRTMSTDMYRQVKSLRGYQLAGFNWMKSLTHTGLVGSLPTNQDLEKRFR